MVSNIGIKGLSSLSILILACCSVKNKRFQSKSESFYQIKSDTVFNKKVAKYFDEEKKYWDSTCQAETIRAKSDIQNNKLTYVNVLWRGNNRSNKEFYQLLKNVNIQSDSVLHFCMVPIELQHCYADVMESEIKKRFGFKFIDSLRQAAEVQYVKKNPDRIYSFEECNYISRYPGDKTYNDFFKNSKRDFWKNVKYPADFEFRKNTDPYSYMSANFILSKTGKISDIKINVQFQNKKNYKYSSYFMNELNKFVQNTKWIPATSAGIKVNSEMDLTIHFK